jgi:predicted hydrolase (HD superfamily)
MKKKKIYRLIIQTILFELINLHFRCKKLQKNIIAFNFILKMASRNVQDQLF